MEPEQRAPLVRAALFSHDSSLKAARLLWDALRETEKRNFADVAMNARQYGAGKELLVIAWDYLDNDRRRSVLSDVLDRLSDKKLESITRNDVEWLVENACGRYGFASVVIEKLAHAMTDGEIAELMRVSDTKMLFGPPKIDCNRLACMNREDRHVFFQFVDLSEDQQSLEFVDRVHQFIDDAERAMLLRRIGIDSMHVAQMLSIGAPWRDWMFEYAPENHDSDEINAAWLAIVNQLPPAAVARLLRICAGGDNRHRLRSVHR